MDGGRWKSQRVQVDEGWWAMNALEFGMKYGSGNHYYFRHFVSVVSLPPELLTSETSPSKET
jgi:hypothetical protein